MCSAAIPRSSHSAACLLNIVNPNPQAGAEFGAASAGIGGDLIVGAPFDNTAGIGAGIVYLFDGTFRLADRGDRQPAAGVVDRLRLGGRIRRVECLDRLAAG